MHVLSFLALAILAHSQTYLYEDAHIILTPLSTGSLSTTHTSIDQCGRIVLRNSSIYHLSKEGIYQLWTTGNLSASKNTLNLSSSLNSSLIDFDVSANQLYLAVLQNQPQNKSYIYHQKHQASLNINQTVDYAQNPTRIWISHPFLYEFHSSASPKAESTLLKKNLNSLKIQKSSSVSSNYTQIQTSPNHVFTVLWDDKTNCQFYTTSSLTKLNLYQANHTPPYPTTHTITFSLDQTLAIIETDMFNPLVVIELNNFTVVSQVQINDSIYHAQFLDSNNTVLIVFCSQATMIVDLATNKQYPIQKQLANLYASDHQNHFYTCSNNTLTQYFVNFTRITSANFPMNDSNQEETFYYQLQEDASKKEIMYKINKTLEFTTQIVDKFASTIAATPITIYFLGFLNFISTSSLYILLNFPMPQAIYRYLSFLYNKLNSNILNALNIDLNVSFSSDERVNRARPLFFAVSSDILQANFSNFLIFVLNLLLIWSFSCLFSRILSKTNVVNFLIMRQRKKIIFGIFFNLMQSLIIPWTFILVTGGFRNMGSKINLTAYIILFAICLFTVIYYFLWLLLQEKSRRAYRKQLMENRQDKIQDPIQKRMDSILEITPIKEKYSSLGQLLSNKIIGEWFLCFANFIFPLLVLVQNPTVFLVLILMHDVCGLMIALYHKKRKVSSTILAVYPLMFHICFMIFYWCGSLQVLSITQIVCLIILLAGFIHNILNIIFQTLETIIKIIGVCRNNQIKPIPKKMSILTMTSSKSKTQKLSKLNSSIKAEARKKVRFRTSEQKFEYFYSYQQQKVKERVNINLDIHFEKSRFHMKGVRQRNLTNYLCTEQNKEEIQIIDLDQQKPHSN